MTITFATVLKSSKKTVHLFLGTTQCELLMVPLISAYCDVKGGWMRLGYINMSESGATCPPGLTQQQYNIIDHDVCGHPNSGVFSYTFFSTQGIGYSKVCGQLRGCQY